MSGTILTVHAADRPDRTSMTLRRKRASPPYRKTFRRPSAEELRRYGRIVRLGWSVGAFRGRELVGLVLAEPRDWNRSIWVWEVGVDPSLRRQGIATAMLRELARRARKRDYRVIVCETQTTNAPAIAFYRAAGFHLEGLDLSYYTNEDVERGEVAIFMKKRILAAKRAARPRTRRGRHGSR